MNENRTESPGHRKIRTILRIAGPVIGLIGLAFTAVGIGSFFAAFGTFDPPRFFWCAFVGLPLVMAGLAITQMGYFGAIYRYMAAETVPVARDAINDLGEGVGPGVKAVSKAMTQGVMEALDESKRQP